MSVTQFGLNGPRLILTGFKSIALTSYNNIDVIPWSRTAIAGIGIVVETQRYGYIGAKKYYHGIHTLA